MSWLILVNPYSGKRDGLALAHEFKRLAESVGQSTQWVCGSTAAQSEMELGEQIKAGKVSAVVVVGGDGLVNMALQHLAQTDIPMMVVAAGTGNDFARTSGLFGKSIQELVDLMRSASPKAVDLGKVTISGRSRWFGQVMSTGFDSVVNERANRFSKIQGKMKYNIATVLELPKFSALDYRIVADGREINTKAMLVAVANGPTYGGGMRICPNADRLDGLFDIMILKPVPKLEFIKVFPKVFKGTHITHPQVEIIQAKSISISAVANIYADGEAYGPLPLHAETVPQTLFTWVC
jgi:diacylglycerol kinase (ATP)